MSAQPKPETRRFIPYRRADIVRMLVGEGLLSGAEQKSFVCALQQIQNTFSSEFYTLRQELKDAYAPLDPDTDTRFVPDVEDELYSTDFSTALETVLERGNYDRVSDKSLQRALRSSSLFQVKLVVDLSDFEEVLLYTRGASQREEEVRELFGLWKRKIKFTNYDRVVLYLRVKPDAEGDGVLGQCPPGRTMLKLFQNVPEADVEMLFPNIRVGMRFIDKLLIGVPALASGTAVFTTKLGATFLLIGSVLGFWLGLSAERVEMDKATMIAALASVGALVGYVWKQFSNFRNRKLKYTQALTENLYFKLLDNNAGAFHRILDDAEEAECKESMLAYYFLLAADQAVSAAQLDETIERWFEQRWNCRIDFEVDDALRKLAELELAVCEGEQWRALAQA